MKVKFLAIAAATFCLTRFASASTSFVNFDNLPEGPSVFAAAGPAQNVDYTGVATFSGGVILGLATNFPAIIYASAPNQYGTASFGDDLSNPITITIDPSFTATEVSFALFNGQIVSEDFTVDAYDGATLVDTQSFTGVPSNSGDGYVLPDLTGSDITSVTITMNDPSSWDFLIDDVSFNESVEQAVNPTTTPEPSSFMLLGSGVLGLMAAARRKLRA